MALKKYGIACKNIALTTRGKVASGVLLMAANAGAFAQEGGDTGVIAAINAAKAAALSHVGLAVGAVIAVIALIMGVGVIRQLLAR